MNYTLDVHSKSHAFGRMKGDRYAEFSNIAVRTMSAGMEMKLKLTLLAEGTISVYPMTCIKSSRDHHIVNKDTLNMTCKVSGRIYRTRHQAAFPRFSTFSSESLRHHPHDILNLHSYLDPRCAQGQGAVCFLYRKETARLAAKRTTGLCWLNIQHMLECARAA